jgi:hypothetical protein
MPTKRISNTIKIKDTVFKAQAILAYHETKIGTNTIIYIYLGHHTLKFDFLATDQTQLEEVRNTLKEIFQ